MGPVRPIFLWLFAAAAAYWDLRYRMIPNRLILLALAGGLAVNAGLGWHALCGGMVGFCAGLMILLPAFMLRMVGGGDVKSLAVIGLLTGPRLLWWSFLTGAAAGGALAFMVLAARSLRFHRKRAPRSAGEAPGDDGRLTLPYAAILAAASAAAATWL